MALQMSFTVGQTGIVMPEAYFRVDEVLLRPAERLAFLGLSVYKDAAVRNDPLGRPLPDQFIPDHGKVLRVMEGDFDAYFSDAVFAAGRTNARRQAYLCLRATRPFFATAINV